MKLSVETTSTSIGKIAKSALKAIAWARKAQPSCENFAAGARKTAIRRRMDGMVMLLAMAAVNVVLDGRLLVGSRPAMLNGGVILAPLDPFVRRFADRIDVDITRSIVRIARRERSITVPIAPYVREEQIVIPLALVVRALGATAYYEGWRTTLSIVSPPGDQIATPTPYR